MCGAPLEIAPWGPASVCCCCRAPGAPSSAASRLSSSCFFPLLSARRHKPLGRARTRQKPKRLRCTDCSNALPQRACEFRAQSSVISNAEKGQQKGRRTVMDAESSTRTLTRNSSITTRSSMRYIILRSTSPERDPSAAVTTMSTS